MRIVFVLSCASLLSACAAVGTTGTGGTGGFDGVPLDPTDTTRCAIQGREITSSNESERLTQLRCGPQTQPVN